jgi:transcriptional regulator with PAS, ATPase and Fis domain
LFGHTKGSFTGASTDKVGLIGQANGGSLLLDEIGEMPLELQPKLLRVLQEKVYYRVGSDKPQEADFRLISATNRNPFEAIQNGTLREDLYYRINTIEIKIPPLRERMDDVPMLAEHFLDIYREKYNRQNCKFSPKAYSQMLSYTWRGNVRELQNVIERAVLLCKSNKIEDLNIPVSHLGAAAAAASSPIPAGFDRESAAAAVAGNSAFSQPSEMGNTSAPAIPMAEIPAASFGDGEGLDALQGESLFEEIGRLIVDKLPEPTENDEQKDVFNSLEYGVVLAALKRTGGNKQAAANLLGLYRPRLYGMIKRHNLDEKIQ